MIAIVDYGVGNLFSLSRSLAYVGADVCVTGDREKIKRAEKIILPGVGAFGDAINKLRAACLDEVLVSEAKKGKPILGICLGMQLLFDKSYEYGEYEGLGLLKGKVVPIKDCLTDKSLKVPHIGWNALEIVRDNPLLKYVKNGDFVYFVHSYCAQTPEEYISCATWYGEQIPALVWSGNVYGAQFHPEKSGEVGLRILKNFAKLVNSKW